MRRHKEREQETDRLEHDGERQPGGRDFVHLLARSLDSMFDRVADQLVATAEVELVEDVANVVLDGPRRNE